MRVTLCVTKLLLTVTVSSFYLTHALYNQGECLSNQLRCNETGKCLRQDDLCDGFNDCGDNEDENITNCGTCPDFRPIKCNGTVSKCIPSLSLCDGMNHCGDWEDEMNCDTCRGMYRIKCNGTMSKCINESLMCDEYNNCGDAEDERNCDQCPSDRPVKCNTTMSKCIERAKLCNGQHDCSSYDSEDELDCDSCAPGLFHCPTSRKCIAASLRCDGNAACTHGEDEQNCDNCTRTYLYHCQTSRSCVQEGYRCNGMFNCRYGEDEQNCSTTLYGYNNIKCNRTGSTQLISAYNLCDGRNDCGDNEDENEKNCASCPSDRPIKCNATRSTCISIYSLCRSFFGGFHKSCPDGEDQRNCGRTTFTTPGRPWYWSVTNNPLYRVNDKPQWRALYTGLVVLSAIGVLIVVVIYLKLKRSAQCPNKNKSLEAVAFENPVLRFSDEFPLDVNTEEKKKAVHESDHNAGSTECPEPECSSDLCLNLIEGHKITL